MGFFDSFKTGFAGGSGGSFGVQLGGLAGDIFGSAVGGLAQRGTQALGDLIFGKSGGSGGPFPGFLPAGTVNVPLFQDFLRPIPFPPGFQFPAGTVAPTLQEQVFRTQQGRLPIDARQLGGGQRPGVATQRVTGGGFTPLNLGGSNMGFFPTTRGVGFQQAAFPFDIPGFDLQLPFISQGQGGGFGVGGGTPMFRAGMAGARAQFFRAPNPVTGQDTWFRPAGRPILWSGDLGACKRVSKVARRARRARPR